MELSVTEDRLREILSSQTEDREKKDLACDALGAMHQLGSKDIIIQQLRDTLRFLEEKRTYGDKRPKVTLEARKQLRDAWEKATPGPWGVWAQQPDVILCIDCNPSKPIAQVDTWTGKGVFDARAMALARAFVLDLLDDLEASEHAGPT